MKAFIDRPEYEATIAGNLQSLFGLPAEEAWGLVRGMYPLPDASSVLAEARARGLVLSVADLEAFVVHRWGRTEHDDGESIVATIVWPRRVVDELLAWCATSGRKHERTGPVVDSLPAAGPIFTLAEMFAALRSEDLGERVAAGIALAVASGGGCKLAGETPEDFEAIIAPQLAALLGRAMAGEAAAVDALEQRITADPDLAHRPATLPEPAAEQEQRSRN